MPVLNLSIEVDPRLPRGIKGLAAAFHQRVTATSGATPAGTLDWVALPNQPGAYQLIDAGVDPELRRGGVGTRMLESAVDQVVRHGKLVKVPARRLVALVNQPDVIARAWLQRSGFVHVHTLEELVADSEVLVLQRTFD